MIRSLIGLSLGFYLCSSPARAQGEATLVNLESPTVATSTKRAGANLVGLNPFLLVEQKFQLRYQRRLSSSFGLSLSPSFSFRGARDDDNSQGFGMQVGLPWYPDGQAPTGFFLEPTVDINFLVVDHKLSATGDAGGMFGYAWLYGDRIGLSLALGVGHRWVSYTDAGQSCDSMKSGFLPIGQLALSVAL